MPDSPFSRDLRQGRVEPGKGVHFGGKVLDPSEFEVLGMSVLTRSHQTGYRNVDDLRESYGNGLDRANAYALDHRGKQSIVGTDSIPLLWLNVKNLDGQPTEKPDAAVQGPTDTRKTAYG